MTVTYHAGRRIQATQADFDGTPAISGGWKEVGRTTLGSSNANISVSSLPDKRYYMVLGHNIGNSGYTDYNMRLNSDTGTNYARRQSINGGSDSAVGSLNRMNIHSGNTAMPQFSVGYLANKSDKEKLHISHYVGSTTGAGNAPTRSENVNKWANTSSAIDEISLFAFDGGTFGTGSEAVVLGWDPADTHTTNFWEELATDTGDGASTDITCTFTAKKYLWIQAWIEGSSSANQTFRLGSSSTPDTGSNYSRRRSNNGGSDTTLTSQDNLLSTWNDATNHQFWNIFIVNNASNEKLCIMHSMNMGGATGAGTAPARYEWVNKWTNTSNQADIFEVNRASGNWSTNSIVKVWGSN